VRSFSRARRDLLLGVGRLTVDEQDMVKEYERDGVCEDCGEMGVVGASDPRVWEEHKKRCPGWRRERKDGQ
jgi:hypothetical protein